jgi:NitT/TauT family transport system permease protein
MSSPVRSTQKKNKDMQNYPGSGQLLSRLSPAISIIAVIIGWELIVRALEVPNYILPPPSQIVGSMITGFTAGVADLGILNTQAFYIHILMTLGATGAGFVLGTVIGVILGVFLGEFPGFERAMMPLISGFQSLPKVALAPLFVIWFGYGFLSRTMLATVLVFFPVMVNSVNGLKNVDQDRIMLAKSLGGTRLQLLRLIKLPSALPFIFSGLEVGIVYALIGAIVGEFVAGSLGLGVKLTMVQGMMNIPMVFAILVLLAVIGGGLHQVVVLIENRYLFWARKANGS